MKTIKTVRMPLAIMALSVAVLTVTGAAGATETDKPEKKQETSKLTVNDLPTAVKATLQEQVGCGKIVEVKQKTKKGQVVFHADVLTHGKDREIDVLADGTLLKKRGHKCVDDCGDVSDKRCVDDCDD